jgi:hypothetical protein
VAGLNLLVALDVLLAEGSVARAARRLRLSPSAMSRTLARLRESTGDPLLVRRTRARPHTTRAREMIVSLLWHPRLDADPARTWLRRCVLDACVTSLGPSDC